MSFETALIDCARVIVAKLLVLPKFGKGKELMLVSEDFLVSRTQIAKVSQQLARSHTRHQCAVITHHITLPCAVLV